MLSSGAPTSGFSAFDGVLPPWSGQRFLPDIAARRHGSPLRVFASHRGAFASMDGWFEAFAEGSKETVATFTEEEILLLLWLHFEYDDDENVALDVIDDLLQAWIDNHWMFAGEQCPDDVDAAPGSQNQQQQREDE